MTSWVIEPRDPLIARDGRPFDSSPGMRAYSLPFPMPSTIIGAIRTKSGENTQGSFDKSRIPELLQKTLNGPLLVKLNTEGVEEILVPRPTDSFMTDSKDLHCLQPIKIGDAQTNLEQELYPVGLAKTVKGKPKGMPNYWYWSQFEDWLLNPQTKEITPKELGINGPVRESRTHVNINPETGTAEEGKLFQTRGLEFSYARRDTNQNEASNTRKVQCLSDQQKLGLLLETDASFKNGVYPLGGERRLMYWQKASSTLPECPKAIREKIKEQKACRLILLTPAFFEKGYLPTWLCQTRNGVSVEVKTVAVQRPQIVSGWDYKENTPKPTRRLAPMGSVYFLSLSGKEDNIDSWISDLWMQNVSDDAIEKDTSTDQNRLDGFGLAVFGTWSGKPANLEVA